MKIRIYQINLNRDTNHVAFRGLSTLERLQGSSDIDRYIYDLVYEGSVAASSLDDICGFFNNILPDTFHGHPLTISDVIEIVSPDSTIESGFYFFDHAKFEKIEFIPPKTSADLPKAQREVTFNFTVYVKKEEDGPKMLDAKLSGSGIRKNVVALHNALLKAGISISSADLVERTYVIRPGGCKSYVSARSLKAPKL